MDATVVRSQQQNESAQLPSPARGEKSKHTELKAGNAFKNNQAIYAFLIFTNNHLLLYY